MVSVGQGADIRPAKQAAKRPSAQDARNCARNGHAGRRGGMDRILSVAVGITVRRGHIGRGTLGHQSKAPMK